MCLLPLRFVWLAYVARRRATLSVGLLYFWFVAVHFNVCERVRFGVYIFALSCCWHDLLPILITSNAGQNMFCVFSCAIKYERRKKKIRLRTAPPQTYVGGRKWLAFIIKPCSCNYSVYYIYRPEAESIKCVPSSNEPLNIWCVLLLNKFHLLNFH